MCSPKLVHILQVLQEGGSKVLQVLDQFVVRLGPVHGEVEAVLVALGSVGEIAGIGTVGDHKNLQILVQRAIAVKAFFAVAMDLVESLTNGHATLFKLQLHQWQAVYQDGCIVAVGVAAGLFKLADHLHPVVGQILFVQQINVLNAPVIKHEVVYMVIVDFAGFFDNAVARLVQILDHKASPFFVAKLNLVQALQLFAYQSQ